MRPEPVPVAVEPVVLLPVRPEEWCLSPVRPEERSPVRPEEWCPVELEWCPWDPTALSAKSPTFPVNSDIYTRHFLATERKTRSEKRVQLTVIGALTTLS